MPKVVLDRADFGEGRWLAEFRKLTIVSIRLGNLGQDDNLLDKLQKAILAIQNVSARFEGTILNIVTTDKGIHVTLVFGLPPLGHSGARHFRSVALQCPLLREKPTSFSLGHGSAVDPKRT